MPKFRLKGVTPQGKLLFKEFDAENKKQAKTLVNQVSSRNSFKVQSLEKKQTFVYKVKKPGKKPISGEQDAYTKQELQNALQNLGYEVIRVEKKLFNFKGRVPTSEVVSFVRLCADLLRQKLTFNEILP
ncbi:MAG: type II secretion system F family protein, partial [Candidatus Marinimicrobia bacterium]|nr:type II secretion system F family protein [Candidatus Neomarinimicrobiota bacterium]